jgi:hypothetical protein
MTSGVYTRRARSHEEILASMRSRLLNMSMPEPNSGCWIFTGCLTRLGYGSVAKTKFIRLPAHRAAYEAFNGPIPAGLDVMHSCDLRCCINPDHLSLGTHADNMADMVRKGRSNSNGHRFPNPDRVRPCIVCGTQFNGHSRALTCSSPCLAERTKARGCERRRRT